MPVKKQKKTGGRKMNIVLQAYTEKYSLTQKQRVIASRFLPQLALCQDEAARRLLLGVSVTN